MTTPAKPFMPAERLLFVTAVSRVDVLEQRLLQSPCLKSGRRALVAHFNAASAAEACNRTLVGLGAEATGTWLVWVHQDVLLPGDWDEHFLESLRFAQQQIPRLAVAGVYGVAGPPGTSRRAGHVLDRGNLLRESAPLPCVVDSLDELLFAVNPAAQLRLDPELGFDFYATDLVLQAQALGWQAAVLDAYCEHWSDTPAAAAAPDTMARRIVRSGRAFETKWAQRLPVETSWLAVTAPGDVERLIESLHKPTP